MQRFLRWCTIPLIILMASTAAAGGDDQACFSESELQQFLANGPTIIQWLVENDHAEQLHLISRNPHAIDQYPDTRQIIARYDWQPQRFAYILSHLVVGYKASKIGPEGNRALNRLQDLKAKIAASPKLAADEKDRLICDIEESLKDVNNTLEAYKSIPLSELTLMRAYRTQLHQTFKGRLTLRPICLPNL